MYNNSIENLKTKHIVSYNIDKKRFILGTKYNYNIHIKIHINKTTSL